MSAYSPGQTSGSLPPPAKAKAATPGSADLDLPLLREQLQDVLGDSIAKHEIVVEQGPNGLVISLRELGFFNSGQANLLPEAIVKIKRVARVLTQHHLEVRVEGHSDNQPISTAAFHSNWELSSARAMTVLELLIEGGGFDPAKVSLGAYGSNRAMASNATPEGRRQNRRVDLVILTPKAPH